VGALVDPDAARWACVRDPPASFQEPVRGSPSASDEAVAVAAAHHRVPRDARLADAVQVAADAPVALHPDDDQWVVPAVLRDEAVVVARDARAPLSQALQEPLAAVLLVQAQGPREPAPQASPQWERPERAQALVQALQQGQQAQRVQLASPPPVPQVLQLVPPPVPQALAQRASPQLADARARPDGPRQARETKPEPVLPDGVVPLSRPLLSPRVPPRRRIPPPRRPADAASLFPRRLRGSNSSASFSR